MTDSVAWLNPTGKVIHLPKLRRIGSTALLAEGNEPLLKTLAETIEKRGFTVELARTGNEASDKAYHCQPKVVLLGTALALQSGFLVAAKLKIAKPSPIVVLITTVLDWADDRLANFIGADGIIRCPLSADELVCTLDRLLGSDDGDVLDSAGRPRTG